MVKEDTAEKPGTELARRLPLYVLEPGGECWTHNPPAAQGRFWSGKEHLRWKVFRQPKDDSVTEVL